MWPWKSQPKPLEVSAAWEDRLLRVEKTQDSIAGAFKKLQLEWEDVYDRIIKAVGRLNARDRTERKAEQEQAPPETAVNLDEINAAIREGRFPGGNWRRS